MQLDYLDYNILWIDNDLQEYIDRNQIKNLKEFLLDLGFQPNIVTLFNESELDDHLKQTKFDLIISDYNLDDTTGDIIIEHIRNQNILTEILFYSAKTDFKSITTVMDRLKFVDRISFHYGRDTLMDRIEKLIELTLDKLLELNATRGLITAATGELDVVIEELTLYLIQNKLNKSKKDLDAIIENYTSDFLDKSSERFRQKHEEIGFENIFSFIEANRKWRIFRDLMEEYRKKDSNGVILNFLEINKSYFEHVIDIRNKFAHAKAEKVEGKLILKGQYGKEDFQFDSESCIEIRKNLIRHKKNFDLLIDYFKIK